MAGELGAFGTEPLLQFGDQRRHRCLTRGETLGRGFAVDGTFCVKDRINGPDRLGRDRRDHRCSLAPLQLGRDVGQLEELAPGMRPAQRAGERRRRAVRSEQGVVAGISVSLENAAVAGEVLSRVLGAAGARITEQGGWWCGTTKRPVIAHVGP